MRQTLAIGCIGFLVHIGAVSILCLILKSFWNEFDIYTALIVSLPWAVPSAISAIIFILITRFMYRRGN